MSSQNEFIAKLNQLGCVTFSGPQATEYLQGQITVDAVTYTHLRAHATKAKLVCRLVPENKNI